jgi:hypothetical protein
MKMFLVRDIFTDAETLGQLRICDNEGKELYKCYTLEDKRGDYGKGCCIAPSTYKVLMTFSAKFQKMLPLVVGVKGRDGIRIHAGNTERDTTGCILVGEERGGTMIWRSRPALAWVMYHLNNALAKGETVYLTITEETEEKQ